ncbi:hypothetical protein CDAR_414451 [Caerostris darwini]|uniref:Secreted protein n=1 Tax=Caerostris darwini TaxID=1538125 RepID=A0AAV4RF90_9ARAC|nr:hypothetical protein CDAR_414451 [Caerostris darwini]
MAFVAFLVFGLTLKFTDAVEFACSVPDCPENCFVDYSLYPCPGCVCDQSSHVQLANVQRNHPPYECLGALHQNAIHLAESTIQLIHVQAVNVQGFSARHQNAIHLAESTF